MAWKDINEIKCYNYKQKNYYSQDYTKLKVLKILY